MLGCQDFCGYYEWTFHYLRRTFGQQAVEKYWAEAIGSDSQQHYLQLGREYGLRGLSQAWEKTGQEERCDWTIMLDEEKNMLRIDMFDCPSKGFLLKNNLNADEDYCDHCIGWIGPALTQIGAEVSSHEHNHCGQCWWEMRLKNRDSQPLEVDNDIRKNPSWSHGYLHRFLCHEKQPLLENNSSTDSCELLSDWFGNADRIVVLGSEVGVDPCEVDRQPKDALIATGMRYATDQSYDVAYQAVVLEHESSSLPMVAKRYLATEPKNRPLLMYAFLPDKLLQNFVDYGLPRPIPILPLLIRSGHYVHRSNESIPSPGVFAALLAKALNKPAKLVDLKQDSDLSKENEQKS